MLFLALANVLSNALKYSSAEDEIEVRGRTEEEAVILEIADTGRGIAADEIAVVWEELGRSRESRGTEGAGLGLPLVRAILERHGGTASLESWHGIGSTVTLRLPVQGPSPGASARASRPGRI
jgi:signal transduction histidine kinase